VLLCAGPVRSAHAQVDQTLTAQLLGKAHALEVRGRMDMAKQTWLQVLLIDQNNSDANAGMARAAKIEGKNDEYELYLNKLKSINPNDPNIARVENMGTAQDPQAQLAEAGRLAQAGQYARAMTILRQVYGDTPPAGDAALSYYQTEAATDDGRPHAIAGLRSLMDKYPQDSRYQIALGKILTYNPRTRAEGRKLLQKHPNDPDATEALKQSLLWDAQNPATSADIRAYLLKHKDQQLSTALATTTAQQAASNRGRRAAGPAPTPEQRAAQEAFAARSKEEQEAYNALNAHHIDDAEARFKVILAKNDKDWQALAGLGYVRMNQSNFGGAISYLEQAKQDGAVDAAVEKALADSRFYFTMQTATAALGQSDLVTAQQQFSAALKMRPNDPTALLGLGGTLMKAQQPEAALPVFAQYVKLQPGDKAAWRGLFMAEYGAGKNAEALATDKRIPPKLKADLLKDPDYLRTLASVYLALGRDADAQRVLKSALDLPFPAGGKGLKEDIQTQFAALLVTAGHNDQAAGLYRQVLAEDQGNTNAWVGLVQVDHSLGKDAEAYQALQTMPPMNYQQAMQEPGFETTVAAIYEGQGHDEMAQDVLEKFLAKQQAEGRKPFVPAQVQLAGIYLRRGNSAQAYPLYQAILVNNPGRADVWKGLLTAMHSTGHDQEAMAELQAIPPDVRRDLENDPQYLQTVGSIYAGLGQPQEAMLFLNRAQQHYIAAHITPPADIDIQDAWLLYNSHNDAALYPQLMEIGGRSDLTDQQRMTVQAIWANWAVRRANEAAAHGNNKMAIAILNAAAKAFPGNPAVIKALASGYATAGMPKEAVAIFRSEDLTHASAADYKAAIGAALAANDTKDAETWLRFGLDQYPRDSQMLNLAARFEMAIGNSNRAAEYYRASLATMPANDPGSELAGAMSQPSQTPAQLPSRRLQQPADLATLLSQPDATPLAVGSTTQPVVTRPYLPSYNGPSITVPVQVAPGANVPLNGPMNGNYPNYSSPQGTMPASQPQQTAPKNSTLKDYVPQSRLEGIPTADVKSGSIVVAGMRVLHQSPAMEAKFGPYRSFLPGAGEQSHSEAEVLLQEPTQTAGDSPQVRMVQVGFTGQQSTTADGTPIVPYAAVAKPVQQSDKPAARKPAPLTPQQLAAARARAAAIHANQADAPAILTGVSHPPQENYDTPVDARVSSASYAGQQPQNGQVVQPPPRTVTLQQTPAVSPTEVPSQNTGQQYPQPRTNGTATATTTTTTTTRRRRKAAPAPPAEQPQAQAPAMTYPTYAQPLSNPGFPAVGPAYPIGQAPTDYELQQRALPPLRGYYDPRIDDRTPLTERQQTELDLATIEGSYSGWVGGSVIGRYRSGTPGIDRLSSVEIPFEASVVVGQSLRLTVIPNAVFLNSGQLVTTGLGTDTAPVLGTLPLGATYAPQQQFASGIGGEFQLATNTFAAAIGYTPYEFLVSNVVGRVRWKPANGHFTFYGGRDAVKETQLSYAGLRDPGQETATFSGPVWGGVVQTGAGVRFDYGDEHAGMYIQGEGAALTGFHTLENRKYDGTMGAYFRVKNWPEYGTLNVGGTLFGEHYDYNERGQTYGLGGYFSPEAYFLAAIPITFNGHSGTKIHYLINGSVGVQTFQEDNQIYFPLDAGLQNEYVALNCTTAQQIATRTCGQQPVNSNTGLNYAIDGESSYQVNEHWFVGGFITGNNTNNYNTISGGFFGRYTFKPQYPTADYPTGLFPTESTTFRPLRVP
jgi:predicted Zn-dependent protease